MSRSRPRTSRVLLIVLGVTVLIGAFTFANQYWRNRALAAERAAGPAGSAPGAPAAPVPPDEAAAVVTQTPLAKPAIKAATPTAGKASTTQPGAAAANAPATTAPATTRSTTAPKSQSAVVLTSQPLQDAAAKAKADDLIAARDIYNAALLSGKLSDDETRLAKEQLATLNETIVFSPRYFPNDEWAGTFVVPPGGALAVIAKRQFNVTPELLARINKISDPRRLQAGQKIKGIKGPLHAVVDKSDFTLDVYFGAPGGSGSSYVTTYRVGLGKDDSTPTGKWRVEPNKKLANPTYHSPPGRGQGVIEADDPRNPLGEYWIGLAGIDGAALGQASYGIHGTIEPDSIGKMASMGCIRLVNEDVGRVFELLVEGKSEVVVKE